MTKVRYVKKKILIIQIIFIILLSMIFNMTINISKSYAISQTIVQGINAFPDSYKDALNALKSKHANWNFTAYNTDLTWEEFIRGELEDPAKNVIYSSNPSKDIYLAANAQHVGGGYYWASKATLEYYSDPRNFLTESGIFQFMEMTYNPSIQNKAGVESILKNSFMDGSVTISAEREDTSIKAKQENQYIIARPGTKNTEVAAAIGMTNFQVKNASEKAVSNDANAGTGYVFTNRSTNASYTMIVYGDVDCDGEITAADYIRIKNYLLGKRTLSNIEKKAADANNDGEISASDYIRIKNYLLGKSEITISVTTNSKSTMKYSEIIMKAAEDSGISPYSIAIKIIQEVGRNSNNGSISGRYPGYEGYYNFYNWGATDGGNAIEKGLIYAKQQGWNNQYTAIVEGAKKLADNYVSVGQNTAYFYKFNVIANGKHSLYNHQYMTNIKDPSTQASNLYNTYATNNIIDASLNFVIPVYKNMPSSCPLPTTATITENSYIVTADVLRIRDGMSMDAKILERVAQDRIITVLNLNAGSKDGYEWAYVETASGTKGYAAKGGSDGEYIRKYR